MAETAEQASAEPEPAVEVPRKALATVNAFVAAHGEAARAVVEYVGTGATRICLVGADDTMGDVVVTDVATAQAVIDASDAERAEGWDRELVNTVRLPAGLRKKMGGYLAR